MNNEHVTSQTDGYLLLVKHYAESSSWNFLHYHRPALSNQLSTVATNANEVRLVKTGVVYNAVQTPHYTDHVLPGFQNHKYNTCIHVFSYFIR